MPGAAGTLEKLVVAKKNTARTFFASLVVTLLQWRGYAKDQRKYLRAEARAMS